MARIKLDTMLDEVNDRLGNVIYSEWKGVKYVRKWVKPKDANSEAQAEIRRAFAQTLNVWKLLPEGMKRGWNFHSKDRPLTGYNLFFKANFYAIRNSTLLELSRGTGVTAPWNLAAAINAAGEISVSFEKGADAAQVSLFVQDETETDPKRLIHSSIDVATGSVPVVLSGFDPQRSYNVYAVASSGALNESAAISDSACCKVTK